MKIKYLKHPVTTEEKAKARSGGYKILDERFKPKAKKAAKKEAKAED